MLRFMDNLNEQRRTIDARLAKSEADFKKGRTLGSFSTAE
jgi:hypothetical protein